MPEPLRISIALCTCNGERFLAEQLDSLAKQTCLPTELVVCDDASDDSTYVLLQDFANGAPFPVRLYRNPQRLGIGANFEQAVQLCMGDIIALCDQDDVWLPNKLATFTEIFKTGVDWVYCDAEVCDAELHSLSYTLWQRVSFDQTERKSAREGRLFDVLLKHFVVAGATLAFRAQVRDRLLPIPHEWHYDAWLAAVLAASRTGIPAESPMQFYRQHASNALGAVKRGLLQEARTAIALERRSYYAEEIARCEILSTRLSELGEAENARVSLDAKIAHLRRRAALPSNRLARLPAVAAEILNGGYSRFARNWGAIAFDLLAK